jgi:hypothetical protein
MKDIQDNTSKSIQLRPISQEQLAAEIKGIYAGIEIIETKCIQVAKKLALVQVGAGAKPKRRGIPWQSLIALYRTLLHEYYDLLFISQHPSASPELRGLAVEDNIPARVWRYGIYPLVEGLQNALPPSSDFMLAFLYFSYSMMALLYETVPIFANIWAEYLRDLCWYALKDQDNEDREVWTCNANYWNSKI